MQSSICQDILLWTKNVNLSWAPRKISSDHQSWCDSSSEEYKYKVYVKFNLDPVIFSLDQMGRLTYIVHWYCH